MAHCISSLQCLRRRLISLFGHFDMLLSIVYAVLAFPLAFLVHSSKLLFISCVCFSFHPASVPLLPLLVQRKGQGVCYENLFSSSSIGIVCQCDICQCQFYWTNIKCICKFCQCTVYLNWCHFATVVYPYFSKHACLT